MARKLLYSMFIGPYFICLIGLYAVVKAGEWIAGKHVDDDLSGWDGI